MRASKLKEGDLFVCLEREPCIRWGTVLAVKTVGGKNVIAYQTSNAQIRILPFNNKVMKLIS